MRNLALLSLFLFLPPGQAADELSLPAGAVARMGSMRLRHPGTTIFSLAFSRDGKQLLSAGDGPFIVAWDVATGQEVRRHRLENTPFITGLAFSPDGKLLSASGKGVVYLFETDTWKERLRLKIDGWARHLAFSPDGKKVVLADGRSHSPSALSVYDLDTGKELERILIRETTSLRLSPDGRYLVHNDTGGMIVHRTDDGSEVARVALKRPEEPRFPRPTRPIYYYPIPVGFSQNGQFLAVHYGEDFVVWDVEKDRAAATFKAGFEGGFASALLSDDGKRLISFGKMQPSSGEVQLLFQVHDIKDGKVLVKDTVARAPGDRTPRIVLSPDGKLLARESGNAIELRDLTTGKPSPISAEGPAAPTTLARLSPDGKLALTLSGQEQVVRLWEVETGKLKTTLPGAFVWADFSSDSRLLATGGAQAEGGGVVQLWNAATGAAIGKLPAFHRNRVEFVAFIEKDSQLLSTDSSGITSLWDVAGRKQVKDIPGAGQKVLAVSGDGKTGLILVRGASLHLQDLTTGFAASGKLPQAAYRQEALLTPDARLLIGHDAERQKVSVWDLREGTWVLPGLPRRFGGPPRLALSGDGKLLASNPGSGEEVHLWELPTGKLRGVVRTGQPGMLALALSGDGKRLLAAGRDGSLMVWDTTKASPPSRQRVVETTSAELQQIWYALGDYDFRKRVGALWDLVEAGDASLKMLRNEMKPVPQNATTFTTERDFNWGKYQLALEAVEYLESDEARKFLQELAAGKAEASLTKAAKAVLERLDRRRP